MVLQRAVASEAPGALRPEGAACGRGRTHDRLKDLSEDPLIEAQVRGAEDVLREEAAGGVGARRPGAAGRLWDRIRVGRERGHFPLAFAMTGSEMIMNVLGPKASL